MKRALFVLIACWAATVAADQLMCPSSGIVDVNVLHASDQHWADVRVQTVTFRWGWSDYPNPEDYVLEIWTWDHESQRYRVWQIEPLGRGVAWLDHPDEEMSSAFLPRFYVRDVGNLCERVEWATGSYVVDYDLPHSPLPNSAWVWDAPSNSFVLKPVYLQPVAQRRP